MNSFNVARSSRQWRSTAHPNRNIIIRRTTFAGRIIKVPPSLRHHYRHHHRQRHRRCMSSSPPPPAEGQLLCTNTLSIPPLPRIFTGHTHGQCPVTFNCAVSQSQLVLIDSAPPLILASVSPAALGVDYWFCFYLGINEEVTYLWHRIFLHLFIFIHILISYPPALPRSWGTLHKLIQLVDGF